MATRPAQTRLGDPYQPFAPAPGITLPELMTFPQPASRGTTAPRAASPFRTASPSATPTGKTAIPRGSTGLTPPPPLSAEISANTVEAQLAAKRQRKKSGAAHAGRVAPRGGMATSLSMPILTPVSLIGI